MAFKEYKESLRNKAVRNFMRGKISAEGIAEETGANITTVYRWVREHRLKNSKNTDSLKKKIEKLEKTKELKNGENPKRTKFIRLANQRVSRVLFNIRLLGNLSNKIHYSYENEDISKIYQTIRDKLDKTEGLFSYSIEKEKDSFSLE